MGLDMLAAYYAYGQDSHALFDGLKIKEDPSYEEHIGKYNVLKKGNGSAKKTGRGLVRSLFPFSLICFSEKCYMSLCNCSRRAYTSSRIRTVSAAAGTSGNAFNS